MGFLAGVVAEINRQEDAATRAEEFMMSLLEKRKAQILPELMSRIEARKEKAQKRSARVNAGIRFGLTDEAAAVLESSGDLESLLVRLQKLEEDPDRTISEAGMNRLSEAVVANLKPEKIASAMAYALDMGYAEEPTSDKLIEAIYANTEEDFETALTPLLTAATSSGAASPDIDRIRVNPMALTSMDSDKTAKVQKQIERSLMSQLGGSYNADTGNIVWQNPDAAGEIIQNAVEYFKVQISDPLIQKDESDVYSEIFDKINFLTGNMSLRDIATNYPTFDYNPQTIERPETPDPSTSATEDLIEEEGED